MALTPQQQSRMDAVRAQIASGKRTGYLSRMIDARGNADQLAIARNADEEIRALHAVIRQLDPNWMEAR